MIDVSILTETQKQWADAVISVGKLASNRDACIGAARKALDELYAFEDGEVLFKPTKAVEKPFRHTRQGALSYFIGGFDDFPEDQGFALRPWTDVHFENSSVLNHGEDVFAMGHYTFTSPDGESLKVEYSFGCRQIEGRLKIFLHHSSLPFRPCS